MRADRLLSILMLLQVHGRVTARQLARRLEVSQRTIYRDMDALSAAGVPVYAERGSGGGWGLVEGYETDLTGLTESEIKTLFLSRPASLLADLGLGQASETALNKLLAALPAMHRRDAEYVRQRIHVDVEGWRGAEEDVSFLPTLQEAVWQERRLYMVYDLSAGPVVECTVDPLGLVAKGSLWYLVAVFEDKPSVYRVSRVQQAHVTDQPCVRPRGFDLASFWKESSVEFRASRMQYGVTVRVAPGLLERIKCRAGFAEIDWGPDGEGWVGATLRFGSEEEAWSYVLGCGPRVEVLEPRDLREKVARLAEGVVGLHA